MTTQLQLTILRWRVSLSAAASDALDGFEEAIALQILTAIGQLAARENPLRSPNVRALELTDGGQRLRVGKYRVFFRLRGGCIDVEAIKHRGDDCYED